MKTSNKEILFAAIAVIDKEGFSEGVRQAAVMETIASFNELFNNCYFEPHDMWLEYILWKEAQELLQDKLAIVEELAEIFDKRLIILPNVEDTYINTHGDEFPNKMWVNISLLRRAHKLVKG